MDQGARRDGAERNETARLETFADGVMAIAITLLILEIDVPHVEPGESLAAALGQQWPSYAAYVVSFLTIGIIWVNHHHLFSVIGRTNNTFLILNVVFLMTIAALPWPTALLAEYIRDEVNRSGATVVYGLTMASIAVMFNAVWRYAARDMRLLVANADPAAVRKVNRSYLSGPITYLATTIIALINAWVALGIIAALALYWLVPGTGPTVDMLRDEAETETAA
ncbi:MAG TPA: TMEM175 family protein [Actinomycetota bacterium]|jgi:uncharacterized membrane protein|nr:TMEM175 family protein [Actinomycetota bacterium]